MRAACFSRPGVVQVVDFPDPQPEPGEAIVRMNYASICGSDVHIVFDGMHDPNLLGKPGYPGHEGVGVVVDSRTERFPVGTSVLTTPPGPAGGCFAELQAVHERYMLALPSGVNEQRMLLAQQLGTTVFALRKFLSRSATDPGTVVIIGAGSAGLFFLQQLRIRGVEAVVVADTNAARLKLADRLGASHTVHHPHESLPDAVTEITSGRGADLVIEAVGADDCRVAAVDLTRHGGTVGLFGYPERPGLSPFPVHKAFRKALTMEWVSGAQAEPGLVSFAHALDLIAGDAIEVDYCLEAMYPLERIAEALQLARSATREAAKVGITMGNDARALH